MNDHGLELLAVACFYHDIAGVKPVAEDKKQNHRGQENCSLANMTSGFFRLRHLQRSFRLCPLALAKHNCH
ncbi:hypothetical protein ES703_98834 [subsurface metagenome]